MNDESPNSVVATLIGSALALVLLAAGANAAPDVLLAIIH